jgi:hypothetical protein
MTRRKVALLATAALVLAAAAGSTLATATKSRASLAPASKSFTLRAGDPVLGVGTETKTVGVPAVLPRADIEIAIDTTNSMTPSITQAKADATNIVTGLTGIGIDAQFAVVQFRDAGDTPEYAVEQSMTSSAPAVQAAINGLSAGGGGDLPEAYNLVFHNSYTPASDGPIGWRSGTRKFVVVLGDAQPHGNLATQGLTGCADVSADPHGFVTTTELAGMKANERTLFMILQSPSSTNLTCYQSLAAGAFAGGQGVNGGANLATQLISLIQAAFANVSNVHLEVASAAPAPASASWITFTPASVGPVPAPSTQTFTLKATVPAGTPAGTYNFDIVALADGVDIGHQALTIIVPQKMLTLSPPSAFNPIGSSHTVTAHVFDSLGPFVGDTVAFTVTGGPAAVPPSGSAPTNSGGLAQFTFSNTPPALGTNTITATDGALSATATKTWGFPRSTSGCKVTGGGRISAQNGDKATFGGNANGNGPSGQEEFQDHGDVMDINVHSISVEAVTCNADKTAASIFGFATIDGGGSFVFRIDVSDLGEPGAGTDHYRIRLSSGYDSGDKVLAGGNIQIH